MPKFAELWVYLLATPLLGLTATLVVYTPGASRLHPSWTGAVDQPGPLDSDGSCQRFALATCVLTPVTLQGPNSFISCWARP